MSNQLTKSKYIQSSSKRIEAANSIVIKSPPVANMAQDQKISVEQCNLCSSQYEKPRITYAQPDLNRLICKVLQVTQPPALEDGTSYFSQYIPVCSLCTTRVREYDKKRIALDILRQEIFTSVLDTLVHIRPNDTTPLHRIKPHILETAKGNSNVNHGQTPITQIQQASPPKSYSRNIHDRKSPILVRPTTSKVSTPTIMRRGSPGRSTRSSETVSAAVDSILPTTSTTNSASWIPVTISAEAEQAEPWNVSGEVSIYSGENDSAPQQITDYVTQHIYVESVQDDDGGEEGEYDDQGNDDGPPDSYADDDDIPESGDPGVAKDPDYQAHGRRQKKSDRKQMFVNSATRNDQPKLVTVNLGDLASNEGVTKKSTAKRKRPPRKKCNSIKPPFFCGGCGRVFSRAQNLNAHSKICKGDEETEKNSKICSICSEDFSISGWAGLKEHIDEVHPDIVLEKCRFCRSEFLPNNFQYHDCATPPELKNYPCDYCGKVFHSSNAVSEHIRRKHDNGKGKKFTCTTCGRSFKSNSILFYHMSTHQIGSTPFACDICGVCTTTAYGLKEHKLVHSGEKPFSCQVCGKTFRIRSILKNHMAVHTREKNFKCEICEKPFALYCTMLRHWKVHTNPKPAIGEHCPLCPNGGYFKKNKTLKEHMILRHPGTKEQFEICSRPLDPEELALAEKAKPKEAKKGPAIASATSSHDEESEEEIEEVILSDDETEKKVAISNIKAEVITGEINRDSSDESDVDVKVFPVASDEGSGRKTRMNTRFHGKKRVLVHDPSVSPPSKQQKN